MADPADLSKAFRTPPPGRSFTTRDLQHSTSWQGQVFALVDRFARLAPAAAAIVADPKLSSAGKADAVAKLAEPLRAAVAKLDVASLYGYRALLRGSALVEKHLPAWPESAGEAVRLARQLDRLHAATDAQLLHRVTTRDPATMRAVAAMDSTERSELLGRLPQFASGATSESVVLIEALRQHAPHVVEELEHAQAAADWALESVAVLAGRLAANDLSTEYKLRETDAEHATKAAVLAGRTQDRASELLAAQAAAAEAREAGEVARFADPVGAQ